MNTRSGEADVAVWDRFVRFGHWTLALAFVISYLSAEELEDVHVYAGYWIGAWLVARFVWGFIGSQHARFRDFVRGPRAVIDYLKGLSNGRAPRYLGHNPAGGAMVVVLMLSLAGTVGSGLLLLGEDEHEGPFASFFAPADAVALPPPAAVSTHGEDAEDGNGRHKEGDESALKELHELFANLSLALIGLHLLGVLASSLVHGENLPRAMVTGFKRKS